MLQKRSLGLIFLTAVFGLPAFGQSAGQITIDKLSWLSGCWEINEMAKGRLVTEQWMKPAGKTMLGMARTVKNGVTSGYEFIRIVEHEKGIYYVAKPSQNASETHFKLITFGKYEAVFENQEHDFPQRISYRREGDKLKAAIEGTSGGKKTTINYPMTRSRCG